MAAKSIPSTGSQQHLKLWRQWADAAAAACLPLQGTGSLPPHRFGVHAANRGIRAVEEHRGGIAIVGVGAGVDALGSVVPLLLLRCSKEGKATAGQKPVRHDSCAISVCKREIGVNRQIPCNGLRGASCPQSPPTQAPPELLCLC